MTDTDAPPLPPSYLPPRTPRNGQLIAVEGISGAGKSTAVALLAAKLGAQQLHVLPEPYCANSQVNLDLAPLPQLAYYLSGLAHAADLVRATLENASIVTDRYGISVLANHAAVHQIPLATVQAFAQPALAYLPTPELTVYLRTSPAVLRARMRGKSDLTYSDRQLLAHPDLIEQLCAHYDTLIAREPTALWIDTDRRDPAQIVEAILEHLNGGPDDRN